ncbi:WcaI family glycosyltransferase [Martelella radicis]|uniref:Colanic acid biosynthesis glycosyl transferase WcaI n=1 Tax=Martelella radicis TaxID=1397476 RepID=A0A7W6KM77_9HYPH|nr:WcaI family glycosyltransferase [Martelella radicis]MBB4122689.1 colanic acid biosynthesis glycosyl transferase WcaI [Martelella radicis]
MDKNAHMRLLIIGINYSPEIISTAVYTSGLAEHFAGEGMRTDVVTALPYYPRWEVFEGWKGIAWRRERSACGVRAVHCPLYVPKNPTGARRILHHASFAITALPVVLWKALTGRPDIVFVVAPSMVSAPVGWLGARICGAKAWLHIQDYEVEAAFATGLIAEDSRMGRIARAFERFVLRRFDCISSISKPMVEKLRKKNVPENRIYELRNWANLEKIRPVEGLSPLKAELGITTPFVALYSGNLANKQGLEILVEIARRLKHRNDLTIVVCGDGPMRSQLVRESEDLPMIRFFPLQPVEKLSDLLGMADVHLLPQIAGAADLVLPSKLTNMLASGRPVVATALPSTALASEVEGAGIVVPPGDGEAMASAIEELLDQPDKRLSLGKMARERALTRWDMTAILGRLKNKFETLIGKPNRAATEAENVRKFQ